MNLKSVISLLLIISIFCSCKKESIDSPKPEPKLRVKLSVDPNQERLGNLGDPLSIPLSNAGQDPNFNFLSAHYLELAPTANTQLGNGEIIYQAEETSEGGSNAIRFSKSKIAAPNELWLEIPLSNLKPGTYEWIRLSLSYQNFDITFYYNNQAFTGTLASFLGFNQYIESYALDGEIIIVNENKKQGYWGFKSIGGIQTGQIPEGAITVPNPISVSSPIPAGSCVVTGNFDAPLIISGDETSDLVLNMSLSINNSFEWEDLNGNKKWDVDQNERVVDMGIRGLKPFYEWK